MRHNLPRLVQPDKVVSRETERSLGLRSQQQTQRQIDRLSRRDITGSQTAIVVTGSWSDGTAGLSLMAALEQLGLVQDLTTR
jgi:hypothetical protein